jgi:hypothetical protein
MINRQLVCPGVASFLHLCLYNQNQDKTHASIMIGGVVYVQTLVV